MKFKVTIKGMLHGEKATRTVHCFADTEKLAQQWADKQAEAWGVSDPKIGLKNITPIK